MIGEWLVDGPLQGSAVCRSLSTKGYRCQIPANCTGYELPGLMYGRYSGNELVNNETRRRCCCCCCCWRWHSSLVIPINRRPLPRHLPTYISSTPADSSISADTNTQRNTLFHPRYPDPDALPAYSAYASAFFCPSPFRSRKAGADVRRQTSEGDEQIADDIQEAITVVFVAINKQQPPPHHNTVSGKDYRIRPEAREAFGYKGQPQLSEHKIKRE